MLEAAENTSDEGYIMHILIDHMRVTRDYADTIKTYLEKKLVTEDKIIKRRYTEYLNEYKKICSLIERTKQTVN